MNQLQQIYEELDVNSDAVEELHTKVEAYLKENGPTHNHELKQEIEIEEADWSEGVLTRVLSQLRSKLESAEYIDIEEEDPEQGPTDRKLWILPDGDTQ